MVITMVWGLKEIIRGIISISILGAIIIIISFDPFDRHFNLYLFYISLGLKYLYVIDVKIS